MTAESIVSFEQWGNSLDSKHVICGSAQDFGFPHIYTIRKQANFAKTFPKSEKNFEPYWEIFPYSCIWKLVSHETAPAPDPSSIGTSAGARAVALVQLTLLVW